MAISRIRMNIFEKAARIYGAETHINLYSESELDTTAVRYGVNWGALGTVDASEAYDFADKLRQLAKVASEINRLELEYDWDKEDPEIKTAESANRFTAKLVEWLRDGRSAKIARFMENGDE